MFRLRLEGRRSEAGWKPHFLKPCRHGSRVGYQSRFFLYESSRAWQFMWLMVGAIFFGCKWLTAWRAQKPNVHLELTPTLGYFFAWPEMDAEKFLAPKPSRARLDCFKQPSLALPPTFVWRASAKILLGAVLLFDVAHLAYQPVLAGWIGMIGMILILHFGLFQLLAAGWRKAGIDVEPIMNAPLRSKTRPTNFGAPVEFGI